MGLEFTRLIKSNEDKITKIFAFARHSTSQIIKTILKFHLIIDEMAKNSEYFFIGGSSETTQSSPI